MSNNTSAPAKIIIYCETDFEATIVCALIAHQTDAIICRTRDYLFNLNDLEWLNEDGETGTLDEIEEIHLLRPEQQILNDLSDIDYPDVIRWSHPDKYISENELDHGPFLGNLTLNSRDSYKLCNLVSIYAYEKRIGRIEEILSETDTNVVASFDMVGVAVLYQRRQAAKIAASHALVFGDFAVVSIGTGSNIDLVHKAIVKRNRSCRITYVHYLRLIDGHLKHCWSPDGEENEENLFLEKARCDTVDYRTKNEFINHPRAKYGTGDNAMTFEEFLINFTPDE